MTNVHTYKNYQKDGKKIRCHLRLCELGIFHSYCVKGIIILWVLITAKCKILFNLIKYALWIFIPNFQQGEEHFRPQQEAHCIS